MDSIKHTRMDKFGNALLIMKSGNIFLKLTKKKKRRLGRIDRELRIFICERKREKHLMIKLNAYGWNDFLLRLLVEKNYPTVILNDDYGRYEIPTAEILENGCHHLHFKQQGFELQRFYRIELLDVKYRQTSKAA